MSDYGWNELAVNFTLAANTAGLCPVLTHYQLVQNGYSGLQLYTVEQCLRVHGREIDNFNPNYHPPSYNENTAVGAIYGPCITWNDLAGTFSMSAHLVGFSVRQIQLQLIRNGYTVSITEIEAGLMAQWLDRLSRLLDELRVH